MHTEIFTQLMTSIRVYAMEYRLIGPEMARKSTTNYNAHPRPGPEEIELEKLFLAGLFPGLLPGRALDM